MTRLPRLSLPLAIAMAAMLLFVPISALSPDPIIGTTWAQPNGQPGPPENTGPQPQGNQSGAGQQGNQSGPGSQGNQSAPSSGRGPEDRPGPPESDRRPVDPVAIRDNATGFRSQAEPGSMRPEISMDAGRGLASVHHPDVHALDVQLDALIEFVDENGNGAYDLGEEVLNRTPLRGAPFDVASDPQNQTRDVTYPLDVGRLTLRFYFGPVGESSVGAKFDVMIDDYPHQREDSRTALGMRVDSAAGLRLTELDEDAALVGQRGERVPYLSWVKDVWVDGAYHPVGASVHLSGAQESDESDSAILYWSYPQGAAVIHDPALGVVEAIQERFGEWLPYLMGAVGVAALLGIGYTTRRRTRL